MRIIQLNIWGGKLGHKIVEFLEEQKPDFVCLQEVNDLEGKAGYKFFAPLDEIRAESGFAYSSMSATWSQNYMERKMKYGNAVLSNLPFTDEETIFTHGAFKENYEVLTDDGNIRNLQIVKVDAGSTELTIFNHHGFWINGTKDGSPETLATAHLIADKVSSIDDPVIICGDFNLNPASESISILSQGLRNLSIEHGLTDTYTHLGIPHEVCDYIFVNDKVKVNSFELSEQVVSDHKALILDFDL